MGSILFICSHGNKPGGGGGGGGAGIGEVVSPFTDGATLTSADFLLASPLFSRSDTSAATAASSCLRAVKACLLNVSPEILNRTQMTVVQ